ncbi:hypothetical protein [Archaeoglobus veneficus]|uniref:hypothetical protein n=1 Tax=Archaeoglobus veneficus TaxID=58290 RepID=UPI00064E3EEA|nr:hypothetical protein [Archaeoglobus veneficus]
MPSEEIRKMAKNISISAGFISLLFVVFLALRLAGFNTYTSAGFALLLASLHAIFRLKTES